MRCAREVAAVGKAGAYLDAGRGGNFFWGGPSALKERAKRCVGVFIGHMAEAIVRSPAEETSPLHAAH